MAYSVNIYHHQFLESQVAYQAAESFWAKILDDLLTGQALSWQPFYRNPYRDGNPLFSAWIPERRKLVRIIQFTPEETQEQLCSAWIDAWAGDWPAYIEPSPNDTATPVPELVIDLALTDVTRQLAHTYLHLWLIMDVSPEAMQQILADGGDQG